MSTTSLKTVQVYANIIGVIAVPILIAFFGWLIQWRLANQSVQRDYLQMAVQILSSKNRKSGDEVSLWAVDILQKYSPVPFSPKLKSDFVEGKVIFYQPFSKGMLNSLLMQPPKPWILFHGKTNGELLDNYLKNRLACENNAAILQNLQSFIRDTATALNTQPQN